MVRFLAQSRKPDPHAQGGSGLRDYLGVLGLRNRGLQPPASDFLVVLSQHVNVNCVIRLDNHVILYQFASSISGLPVRVPCGTRGGATGSAIT